MISTPTGGPPRQGVARAQINGSIKETICINWAWILSGPAQRDH